MKGPYALSKEVKNHLAAGFLIALAGLAWPLPGDAATPKDIKIGIHVIDFVTNPPADHNSIAVVFDGRVKESAEDAQVIFDALNATLPAKATSPKPLMVDIRDLDEAVPHRLVIVAERMKPYYDKLSEYGRHTGSIIMSTDLDCARSAKCTVGIASSPRVEILVSTKQAQSSGIQFSEAFRMMVTEY